MTGEYRNCPSKNFHLAVLKKAVGEAFSLSFVSRIEKKCFRGLIHDFLSKLFCLTVPEFFVGEPFILPLISRIEKFYASKGYVKIFCRNFFFVSQHRNISLRNPSIMCFRKNQAAKKFLGKNGWGVSKFSVENFLSHSVEKNRRATL